MPGPATRSSRRGRPRARPAARLEVGRSTTREVGRRGSTAKRPITTVTTALRRMTRDHDGRSAGSPQNAGGLAAHVWRPSVVVVAAGVPPWRPSRPPGSSTRRRSPWPASAIAVANRSAGVCSHLGRRPGRLSGLYVPQWIGTTNCGRISSVARAARSGSRCPVPSDRSPSGDRQQRHVDRLQLRHSIEQVGVPGEVDAPVR